MIDKSNTFNVPVRCDGAGTVRLGPQNVFGYDKAIRLGTGEILLQPRARTAVIEIGTGNWFSNNVSLVATQGISIGDGCQIGDMVTILDSDFHEVDPATRKRSAGASGRVTIGNNVWLGSRVMILKGVTVGANSVIGPMSVVTRNVAPNSVAVGAPARFIRSIGSAEPE
jgi:maltose O-acetyltransferase